jgi:hypothetical protein
MSCKSINSEENKNIITNKTNEENVSIEENDEKLIRIISNFIDSIFEESSKEIKLNLRKDLHRSMEIKNKNPIENNYSQSLNRSCINDSELSEQKLKINKKKFIYEERLRMINQQISFLQKQKSKLNKQLSLMEVNEKSLYSKSEKILKREDKINNEKEAKDKGPENKIKFFNEEVEKNGSLYPFASEEKKQNSDNDNNNNNNDLLRSSHSLKKDMRREKQLTKDIKIINLNNIYNFKITDFNSYRGYRNIILNKKHFNIENDIIFKSKFKYKG